MDQQKLIQEAAHWLLLKATVRPISEIAKEAGMSVNKLKYQAKQYLRQTERDTK
jgi:hypothetical protein